MPYRIVPDESIFAQVAALPVEALAAYAQVLDVLEVAPWNGEPQHLANSDGAVRRWLFGPDEAGQVLYLIVEEPPEVHVLLVQWLG
ncbi:hypothetical protein [Pseudonocardia sp.]|uniref:hypothetical protein n=1 Tax=Pseudonocardia sp. TaxID=60912 RepID=UPI002602B3D8|nr:hypothetical protein [Pseudonocardia sp.]